MICEGTLVTKSVECKQLQDVQVKVSEVLWNLKKTLKEKLDT